MPSPLRFRLPVQGQGIGGGVGQESGVEWHHVYALGGDLNGLTKWSRQKNYTGFTHDTEYLMRLRNRGSGGRHLTVLKSTDASTVLQVTDTGLTTALAITSTLATGTAPFTVASTTKVTNLNADLLDGLDSTAFATSGHNHDAAYVNTSGDTMTGALTIEANQGLKLKNSVANGTITLNATAAADPTLEIKDNSGDDVVKVYASGSTYSLETLGAIRAGTNLVVNDWTATVSGDDLVWQDDAGQEMVRFGDTSSTYHLKVTGPAHITGEIKLDGAINHDGTTIGFFNSAPSAKETITGSRGGNAALANLLSALANYGLITDSTS